MCLGRVVNNLPFWVENATLLNAALVLFSFSAFQQEESRDLAWQVRREEEGEEEYSSVSCVCKLICFIN